MARKKNSLILKTVFVKKFNNSNLWWEKASKIIPGGCSTIAKSPLRLYANSTPFCCSEANGAFFKDIDGNEWLDCEMSMGSIIWGHSREEINNEIIKQLKKGTSYSIPSNIELELAELIIKRFNYYNSIRFCKSGADAVSAAVRIARVVTSKEKVVYGTYHGWHDWSSYGYYNNEVEILGIPKNLDQICVWLEKESLNEDLKNLLEKKAGEIACLVISPSNWLQKDLSELKISCRNKNIVLIFDEVTSGMRWGLKGATGVHGVWPDILCISKGLANGMALGAILADKCLLNVCLSIKMSNAHSTECISMAAAFASEKLLENMKVWPTWKSRGQQTVDLIREKIIEKKMDSILTVTGNYASFRIHTPGKTIHTDKFREFFVKFLANADIFSMGYILLSDKHTNANIEMIQNEILAAIKNWAEMS